MILALVIFLLTYALMIALPNHRYIVALISAALFVILGFIPLPAVFGAIDWNIILMLFGMMGTVSFFIDSGAPAYLASALLAKTSDTRWAIVLMSVFAGVVSAFLDNVATVLMIAPVGLAIAKELKISPVAMLICISVSSNLQGAATLVGDTTSIMLGSYARMDFIDFIFMNGRFSIFWAVELGAAATIPVMLFLFRRERGKIPPSRPPKINTAVPGALLILNIVLLIGASFIKSKPEITNGLICTVIFAVCVIWSLFHHKDMSAIKKALLELDVKTLLLLCGLFVVIEGITRAGIIDSLGEIFVAVGGKSLFLMYTIIVWGSVICSAFVDNIPFVATLLPVVTKVAATMGCDPTVLYFGLLCGATLGGNLTPIGASANIAATGILRREGYTVKFGDFAKIGIPFTLTAVVAGYLFIWFVWA